MKNVKVKLVLLCCLLSSLSLLFVNLKLAYADIPRYEETTDTWILSNGDLRLTITKEWGWISSLTYDGSEMLPHVIATDFSAHDYVHQFTISCNNGTYRNFVYPIVHSQTTTENYTSLTINYTCDTLAGISGQATYSLNVSSFTLSYWTNFTSVTPGNFSQYHRFGTDLEAWNSIIIMGGDHGFTEMAQWNSTDQQSMGFFHGVETGDRELYYWDRPMAYPFAQWVKTDLTMSLYSQNYFDAVTLHFWDGLSGHDYRTDAGFHMIGSPSQWIEERAFTFEFTDLDNSVSWTSGFKTYFEDLLLSLNYTGLQAVNQTLRSLNLYDIHPHDWENDTRIQAAKDLNAKVLWLYGWQAANESYILYDGSWTTKDGEIGINSTYLKDKILQWQNEGLLVYLYIRDFTDYNVTILSNPAWCQKINSSSYYWGWELPDSHVAVRWAFSNSSFQDYYYNILMNLSSIYHPNGFALDWGGMGTNVYDCLDYGQGWHSAGILNLTKRLYESNISLIHNTGMQLPVLFSDGTLFECPSYNGWLQLELVYTHLYNATAYVLTTGLAPEDQTNEGELFWTSFSLASGCNRGFDYNLADLTTEGGRDSLAGIFNGYFSIVPLMSGSILAQPANQNNFNLGIPNFFTFYWTKGEDLWIILFNNGTSDLKDLYLYQFSNKTYSITQTFISTGASSSNNTLDYYYRVNLTDIEFADYYLQALWYFNIPVRFGLGAIGFVLLFICPIMMVKKFQEHEFEKLLFPWFIGFIFGACLIIGWLFPLGYG